MNIKFGGCLGFGLFISSLFLGWHVARGQGIPAPAEFAEAFLADHEFTQKFKHPIWIRWAKLIGEDRSSRELFAELLSVEGAIDALDKIETDPKLAEQIATVELKRLAALEDDRRKQWTGGYSGPGPYLHSFGENSYALYLAVFAKVVDATVAERIRVLNVPTMGMGPRGGWTQEKGYGRKPPTTPEPKIPQPALWKLMIESQLKIQRTNGIYNLLTAGATIYDDQPNPLTMLLPLAKIAARQDDSIVRAASWIYLAEADEREFLPDIVKFQDDAKQITKYSMGTEKGSFRMNVLISDIAIASQLMFHKQQLRDFGYFAASSVHPGERIEHNLTYYGFPDDGIARKTAHKKALAFLKTSPSLLEK